MKNTAIFLISFLLLSCKDDITSSGEVFFNPVDINALSLDNIADFWEGDSIISVSNPTTSFNYFKGWLTGVELRGNRKSIEIDMFESKDIALTAIEDYRSMISMYTIESDDHNIIKEKWWCPQNSYLTIFVNKYNTFIRVHYGLEAEDTFTQNIAAEIIGRMEQICR